MLSQLEVLPVARVCEDLWPAQPEATCWRSEPLPVPPQAQPWARGCTEAFPTEP